ncbi:long-chain fatty acid--CoA ligase [Phycicoccus sp. Soil803]|uniref:AMP-dependent synthetase/ligase n=1 Tax=Phycicoccus sp. Soil803 TaxID=1736415 RepID=UPI00070CC596|nr:AMP-dependent synthetase/ligase [Phycicoccus sp. Soil803]KRF25218.1 long-chain fatty acid--CoA ligase [Phycicoccus sp. Soil803]
MQEHVAPPLVPPTTKGSLADLPGRNAASDPTRVAFSRKEGSGWVDVTAAEFDEDVRAVAKGLIAAGIAPGDRVAIMCKTRYEWTLTDFAIWTAGAVTVPIYETSSAEQVAWILTDSGAKGIMLETPSHAATLAEVRDQLPGLEHAWQVDAGAIAELKSAGAEVSDADLEAAKGGLDRASIATIIYTSGTTGRPKGVQLTHDNFLALSENAITKLRSVVKADGASTLLFLPLAHVFARFIQVLCVTGEAKMGHSADIKNLLADFAEFKPTFILSVPRVFEKIYNSAEAKATAEGKGKIFAAAADTAIAWSSAQDTGGAGLGLKVRHGIFDKLVYAKLRAAMGGRVMYAVSGGAPLGTRLGHFFRGIGVTVLEGYGLTETTAPATVNVPDRVKIGTVGAPLPGVGIRIADDGEILIQGNNVFAAYHNNAEATSGAVLDGWFHTGDIGELDEDGYLRITGRKKELLVTAGGKNVAPAGLEDRLRAHPLISQCIVVGDQKPFIGALLTLDDEMYPGWAKNNGLSGVSFDQARTNETVLAELQKAVDDANKSVSKAESIRKFAVLPGDFTEENGYLTPSLKLKRNIVMKDFHDEVEALYSGAKE